MRKTRLLVGIVFCVIVLGCQEPSAPKKEEGEVRASATAALAKKSGKELFQETALGTNGKSCYSCHPDGEGISGVGERLNKRFELQDMINKCIVGALKGKEIGQVSSEMKKLHRYLLSMK